MTQNTPTPDDVQEAIDALDRIKENDDSPYWEQMTINDEIKILRDFLSKFNISKRGE